jgi:hypothetical protein
MCAHLCFPLPNQLPGPEVKLFVDQVCIAVCPLLSVLVISTCISCVLLSLSRAQHSLTGIHQQGVIHSAVFFLVLLAGTSLGSHQ